MKHLLIFIITLLLVTSVQSQIRDSLLYKYNNQTIYRYGNNFMKGTERLSFQDLQNEFSFSEIASVSYDKAKRSRTTSRILSVASMLTGFASIAILADGGNRKTASLLLAGQIALVIGGSRYKAQYSQFLDKALWQRNKDLLFTTY